MNDQHKKNLADKFFNNRCSPDEAEMVLEWLDTVDGQRYLDEKIDRDFDTLEDDEVSRASHNNSEKLFEGISNRIDETAQLYRNRFRLFSSSFQFAACLLIIMVGSLLFITQNEPKSPINEPETVQIVTGTNEQRDLKLADGTRVRLNSNSILKVSADYMRENRVVYLEGEAFFEVEYNPEQVFTIISKYTRIEVLGTSFNVRTDLISTSTQVAVSEGRVLVQMNHAKSSKDITIDQGEYAYLNYTQGEIIKESSGADIYMAWINNRLQFKETTLENLCRFISRTYNKECYFDSKEIEELIISATFTNSEIGYVLEAIAMTLDLNYNLENNSIKWEANERD